MSNELKPCPFCGGEVYYRVTGAGVTFFNCIHCKAGITFSSAAEELPPATAKYLFNNRASGKPDDYCSYGERKDGEENGL